MRKILSLMLAIAMLCTMVMPMQTVLAADADILYNTEKTWFPLTDETGANAKYFLAKGAYGLNVNDDYSDFLRMVDYGGISKRYSATDASNAGYTSGVGYYPTGTDTVLSGQFGAFAYTIDAGTDNTKEVKFVDLITKNGETFWNINGKDYKIDTTGKVIKILNNVRTELITDAEVAARFETLDKVTLDVTDGYYNNIGFLVGLSSQDTRAFTCNLIYADGTTSKINASVKDENTTPKYAAYGFAYRQAINPTQATMSQSGNTSAGGNCRYVPVVINSDVTKKLNAIEISAATDWEVLYIISCWGEKPSFDEMLKKIPDVSTLTEENIADAQVALDKFMDYVDACGYSYNDLDAAMKAKVDAIRSPYAQILANKLATLDENAEINGENIYTYKAMLDEIESYKNANSLEYTAQQTAKINTIKANIEAVEYGVILKDVNEKIESLPSAESVNVDNFAEVSAKVQEINKIIADNNIDIEDINTSNKTALDAMQVKLNEVVLDVTTIIPMNIQDGANAKFFLALGEEDPDYVEWKDYMTGTWFSSVSATTSYNPKVIRYSTTVAETTGHIYAPNNIWTMKDIPYYIGSDVKGIRLHGDRKVTGHDDAVAKIMSSFSTTTINLEKGFYEKIYLAGLNNLGNEGDPDADVSYVLTYKDGTKAEGVLSINYNPSVTTYLPSGGYIGRTSLDPNDSGVSSVKADNYVIDTDATKQVDTLKLTCTEGSRIVYFLGAAGETAKIGVVKEAIESKLSYSISGVGTATKETLLEIEDLINEYKAAGGDVSGFEGIERFKQDIADYYAGVIELKGTSFDVDFDNTYFTAEYTKDVAVPENVVSITKNGETLAADKFTVIAEGNKVKVAIADNHSKINEYIVTIKSGVASKENTSFYVEKEESATFKALKAMAIDKFELADGTISVEVSNNMKATNQNYILVIAAYDNDNKLVGVREVKGELKAGKSIQAALDASAFENGVTVECYLADTIDNLKYLDTAAAITIAQ